MGSHELSANRFLIDSLQMPEEEVSYALIGQGFLQEEPGQRVVQVLLVLQNLETTNPPSCFTG